MTSRGVGWAPTPSQVWLHHTTLPLSRTAMTKGEVARTCLLQHKKVVNRAKERSRGTGSEQSAGAPQPERNAARTSCCSHSHSGAVTLPDPRGLEKREAEANPARRQGALGTGVQVPLTASGRH